MYEKLPRKTDGERLNKQQELLEVHEVVSYK